MRFAVRVPLIAPGPCAEPSPWPSPVPASTQTAIVVPNGTEWGSHSQVVGQEHLREAKPAIGSACHRRAANGLAVANWLAHQRQTLELERRFQRPPSTSDLPSNDAHRSPVGGRPRVRGSVDLREDHGCYGCRRIQKSVTLTRAFILCCCPGARSAAKGPTLLVSIQIICFHSSSAKSDKECAFSTHGFHTTVVREFSFVTRVRRCKTGSSSSIAPVVSRYTRSVSEAIAISPCCIFFRFESVLSR